MAKDPASTRIPRLDGVSRIPPPGSVRPELIALRPTRNPRPSSAFLAPRTGAFTGLRPPSSLSTNLKKSSSGDRINSAVNMVSKKTTSAFKKLFSKPEKSATPSQRTAAIRKAPPDPSPASSSSERQHTPTSDDTKAAVSTPRPFTRSETFIRDPEDQLDMLGVTHDVIAQSTPMVQSKAAANENTHLLQTNAKPQLCSTYALENAPSPVSHLGDTVTLGPLKSLQRTQILDSTRTVAAGFVRTINFESPQAREVQLSGDATMTLSDSNSKKPSTPLLGETVSLDPSPGSKTFVAENELRTDNQFLTKQSTSDLTLAVMKDAPSIHDPCKAIESSTEDLKMIQDISMPPECDVDLTLKASATPDYRKLSEHLEDTLMALTPDGASMNLQLNSTMNTDRLLDLTVVTPRHMQQLNLTRDYIDSPTMGANAKNTTQLLYMTQVTADKSTPDHLAKSDHEHATKLLPHLLLKGAQSELFLPTRTPEDELMSEPMEVDTTLTSAGARAEEFYRIQQQHHQQQQQQQLSSAAAVSLQELNSATSGKPKSRFSFGLDLTDCTLDCSIELCDISLSSTILSQPATMNSMVCNSVTQSPTSQQQQQLMFKKQNSFEMDESLGILTPDQMKEFMDSTTNTNNLELPLNEGSNNNNHHQKMSFHAMRFDQTPSPEDLPLDPVEVRTDIADMVMAQQQQQLAAFTAVNATQQQQQQRQQLQQQPQHLQSSSVSTEPISTSTCDTELSKADPMTKSSTSKISNSFITSVTSVTSLDTGYQGDGEMSRPASRGAGDHSPSNGPTQRKGGHVSRQPSFNQQQQPQQPPIRRQDPMTDSDFFTESDADDLHHRGDRRAQVIDGQLYGPMQLQPSSASVFISEDPQMEEDSCMESSGIFTDVENRCEDDLALLRRQDTQDVDMSPDGDSTDTVKSNRGCAKRQHENESDDGIQGQDQHTQQPQQQQQQLNPHQLQHHQLSDSQTSSTIQSSFSNDRLSMTTEATGTILSNRTSYCSVEDGGGGSGAHVDRKSFGSLEEAFAPGGGEVSKSFGTGKSPTSSVHGANGAPISSVSRVSSTRKHSSLTSLCTNTGVHVNSSSTTTTTKTVRSAATRQASSSQSSPKVSPAKANETRAKVSPPRSFKTSPASPRTAAGSSVSPTSSCGSTPNLRKAPVPNKWEAVMNKIASNKLLIKKNYNDVKSKVSTGVGGGAGRGGTLTPPVRPSGPSVYVAPFGSGGGRSGGRSGGVSKVLNSKSSISVSPTDTGSTGQGKPRLLQGVANRGRSYSKDSEKSSQSDLSLSSGSPKLLAKTTLRAAKKRDVRNLSISPTDLGPPPKTQQTANGASTRPKPANATLKQKRPLQTLSPATSNPGSNIGTGASTPTASSSLKSLSSKKFTLLGTRRLEVKATAPTPPPIKAPLKDHNRIITPPVQQQQQQQSITPTTTPTSNKNGVALFNGSNNSSSSVGGGGGGSKPQTPTTENSNGLTPQQHRHERNNNNNNHHSSNNSNNNNNSSNNVSPKTTTTTTARSNSQNSSPVLSQYYGNRRSNNDGTPPTTTTGTATTTKTVDEKTSTKLPLSSNSNSNSRKQIQPQHRSLEEEGATSDESHPSDELQQLKHLNRHSCNGRLDYQSLEQHLQQTAEAQQQQNKGIEAMGALMQYLVFDLDAFACSGIKAERTKLEESLTRTLQQLDEAKSVCSELQDTLCDKEAYYTQREEELQDLHRCELEKVQRNVSEMQLRASEQISALKIELHVKEAEQKRSLDCYRLEMENKLALKDQQLLATQQSEKALLERITELEKNGLNLRMELKSAEESSAQRLQATTKRERDLLEKLRVLNKELDILRETKASNERDLKDKLNLSQEEVSVLRTSSRRSLNSESLSGSSPRNSSSASIAAAMEITRLQSEAESLRCVLELKQKEISKLTKHNEELLRDADERASLQAKISLLEARNEMLQSELEIKSEKEKDFQRQVDEIQKAFNHETVKRTRLSYDNEALQWQLKQRSEQLHIVEAKLQELSSQDLQTSQNSSLGSLNRSHNGASLLNVHADDEVSPPVSPIIKAVIEKTDSVSWVLEMDDDTPEAAASKMVKRAGSFRSFERSPSTRRHLSVSANAATSAANTSGQGPGPNPLSQSMSAASVIRQHSNEAVDCLGRSNSRIRSKSVSVKSAEPTPSKSNKKVLRQSSTGSNRKNELVPPVWKEPMNTSSPYTVSRPRSSTLKCAEQEEAFYRSSACKLITCDTSALNSGERLELRGLPTHPSVQDLKAPKKSQQIQESAGEAMVSGTNSEDEGCSHSSDEVVSSSTTSISSAASATSGSSLSLHHIKSHQHMSLEEEVLLLDKINSLNGTPMEVSWSDEADAFATNTTAV